VEKRLSGPLEFLMFDEDIYNQLAKIWKPATLVTCNSCGVSRTTKRFVRWQQIQEDKAEGRGILRGNED